jgi:hypothetical protein
MQGGRHVTDDCTRRRRHCSIGVPNLERIPEWTSRYGFCDCSICLLHFCVLTSQVYIVFDVCYVAVVTALLQFGLRL